MKIQMKKVTIHHNKKDNRKIILPKIRTKEIKIILAILEILKIREMALLRKIPNPKIKLKPALLLSLTLSM
jgi:hypothetical protein